MRNVIQLIVLIVFMIAAVLIMKNLPEKKKQDTFSTEGFIETWLRNDNGTLATYVRDGDVVDEDLVKGREALAETLGLWMLYAIEKNDQELFHKAYQNLRQFFLEKDGYIHWKINESGKSDVYTNALVDDLRIVDALFQASAKWGIDQYEKTAKIIGSYVNRNSKKENLLTDFYERRHRYSSDTITLSYIDPAGINAMKTHHLLGSNVYENTLAILENAPLENGFYPKSYNVSKQSYHYDQAINMVDQALVAYHQAKMDIVTAEFFQFVKQEMNSHGRVYGMYNKQTKENIVDYESPAVYGVLIMYCLELGEVNVAQALYERMIAFRENDYKSPYYGGYSVSEDGDTHIFDNVVPLLAEHRLFNSLD